MIEGRAERPLGRGVKSEYWLKGLGLSGLILKRLAAESFCSRSLESLNNDNTPEQF